MQRSSTFQILSYVIDVYRGDVTAQRNLIDLAAYVAMFPQLIAGPIVRYADIAPELTRRRHTLADAAAGARRFVVGLGKKVLIANVLYELMSAFLQSTQPSVLFTWLYAVACALQIYFDFSGYSDMAVGLGQIFGFHFPENFRYPFLSGSVTEFWRRWHISLGSWFRDYVYIPLGGSRCSRSRWLLNVFLVWGLTGLWHGAAWNFVLWGLFFAVLLAVSFVLFNAADLPAAGQQIAALFGFGGLPAAGVESLYYLRSYAVVLVIALLGATPLPAKAVQRLRDTSAGSAVLSVAEPVALVLLLALCTAYLVDGSFNPFLYFRF